MKAKLIKNHYGYTYFLADENGDGIATSDNGNLSKQNCDEIFGVFDVEKLAEECAETAHTMDELYENGLFYGFVSGFNKAMELNKDKLFTVEDIRKAIEMARKGSMQEQHNGYGQRTSPIFISDNLSVDTIIQSLQQPTEIEVEIVMEEPLVAKARQIHGEYVTGKLLESAISPKPKLDSPENLILKKI